MCIRDSINKEIADKLNISLTTVISHRKNITEKLGIKSVSGLTIYAAVSYTHLYARYHPALFGQEDILREYTK